MNRATILYSNNGRPVAKVRNRILEKTVEQNRHQLKSPPAWALDESVFAEALGLGVESVEIKTRDTRRRYTVTASTFEKNCRTLDRGFGVQVFLPLNFWDVESLDHKQTLLAF